MIYALQGSDEEQDEPRHQPEDRGVCGDAVDRPEKTSRKSRPEGHDLTTRQRTQEENERFGLRLQTHSKQPGGWEHPLFGPGRPQRSSPVQIPLVQTHFFSSLVYLVPTRSDTTMRVTSPVSLYTSMRCFVISRLSACRRLLETLFLESVLNMSTTKGLMWIRPCTSR